MIHAAIPDTLADGLINFDKKRKEFEVLAQIKLLQVSEEISSRDFSLNLSSFCNF